jgi:HEPN domain-containing protein
MDASELRQKLLDRLLAEIKEEQYPSVTFLDRVEAELRTPEQVLEYAEVLFEKIESSRYPSVSMLDRFDAALARVE